MKIGKQALATVERTLEEVDAALVQLTGMSAREMRAALSYPVLASTVASALMPLLAEPIERHALAEAIAAAGTENVKAKIQGLYDKLLAKGAPDAGEAKD